MADFRKGSRKVQLVVIDSGATKFGLLTKFIITNIASVCMIYSHKIGWNQLKRMWKICCPNTIISINYQVSVMIWVVLDCQTVVL